MIQNREKLKEFERQLAKSEKLSYPQALAIYESLIKEALALGVFNNENIMDGIEADIRIAKALSAHK